MKNAMQEQLSARHVLDRYSKEDELPTFFGMDLTDVNQVSSSGEHPLDVAATRGSVEEIRALLSAGAEVNATGTCGRTVLHEAVAQNHPNIVQILITAGASPLLKDSFNLTPLEIANLYNLERIIEIINNINIEETAA